MKYTAIFEVSAIVHVAVEVDEDNQTEALAQAHDDILQAATSQAKIVSMALEHARNIALERETPATKQNPAKNVEPALSTEVAIAAPVTANSTSVRPAQMGSVSTPEQYELQLFEGSPELTVTPVSRVPFAKLSAANDAFVSSVLAAGSRYGGGRVLDNGTGEQVLCGKNARGDWEVSAYDESSGEPMYFESWLSRASALTVATRFATQPDVTRVVITDYSNRLAGPQHFRTIE